MVIGNNSISLFILLIYYIYNIFGLERINVSLSVIYCFVDIRLIKSSIIISYIVDRYNNTFIYTVKQLVYYTIYHVPLLSYLLFIKYLI